MNFLNFLNFLNNNLLNVFLLILFFIGGVFVIKYLYLYITRIFYTIPFDVKKQQFWITEVKINSKTFYHLNIKKTWGKKSINIVYKKPTKESHCEYIDNTIFPTIEKAEQAANDLSNHYSKGNNLIDVPLITNN